LVSSSEYIAEHLDGAIFVNPDGRQRVEDLALGLYNFGNQLISDDEPEKATEIKDIKLVEREENLERAEHLDNIRQFVGNMVFRDSGRVLKPEPEPERKGRLSDQSLIQHLGYVAGKTVESGRANEAESQGRTLVKSPIDKFINRLLDQLDNAPVGARQELETAALRRGMKFLREKMKAAGYDYATVK
jgi:hypothetical protein